MACGCKKNKQTFEVVAENGKVVFQSSSKPTADTVSGRYPNSTVREQGKPGTEQATQTPA